MAVSVNPVTKNLPSSVARYTFFMRKVSFDRILQRPLLVSVSSSLLSDVSTICGLCNGPCFSLFSTSFSSVNIRMYIVHQTRKLLNQIEARNTNFSSMEITIILSLPRKRSDTRTPSDDKWHESQWRQDRWRIDLKGTSMVKIWSQHGTILVNSSFEHKYYHHYTPAPTTPASDLD